MQNLVMHKKRFRMIDFSNSLGMADVDQTHMSTKK